jgi:hypothetical protein
VPLRIGGGHEYTSTDEHGTQAVGGAAQVASPVVTRSLKGAWFQPLKLEALNVVSWFQSLLSYLQLCRLLSGHARVAGGGWGRGRDVHGECSCDT